MRSRYSAYALDLDAYVLETWAPETRPAVLFEDGEERPKWLSLVIHSSYEEGAEGRVSFTARGQDLSGRLQVGGEQPLPS